MLYYTILILFIIYITRFIYNVNIFLRNLFEALIQNRFHCTEVS